MCEKWKGRNIMDTFRAFVIVFFCAFISLNLADLCGIVVRIFRG